MHEVIPAARGLTRPLNLENGRTTAPDRSGHGVELDFDAFADQAPSALRPAGGRADQVR